MNDYIIRATAEEGSIRIFVSTTKNTINRAFEIHKTSPIVIATLGRMLTAACIMGCMLKNDKDLITLKLKCDGPLKGVVVTSDSKSRVRGYVHKSLVDIPLKLNGELDFSSAIGNGMLTVVKDLGLKEAISSQIPLVSGEMEENLTYYFSKSEQIPSVVSLGILIDRDFRIKQAGGFIIQVMPNASEKLIGFLERKIKNIYSVTTLLEEGNTPEDMIKIIFKDYKIIIYDKIPVQYYCNCSRSKVEKAFISLGLEELKNILKEDKQANLHCHFCNKDYSFDEIDLKNLIEKIQ